MAYQRLWGQATGDAFAQGTVEGVGVDVVGSAGTVREFRWVRLGFAVEGGVLAGGPTGRTPGDPVSLTGGWIGGGFRLGLVPPRARP